MLFVRHRHCHDLVAPAFCFYAVVVVGGGGVAVFVVGAVVIIIIIIVVIAVVFAALARAIIVWPAALAIVGVTVDHGWLTALANKHTQCVATCYSTTQFKNDTAINKKSNSNETQGAKGRQTIQQQCHSET